VLLWLDLPPDVAAKRIATDHHDAPRDRQPGLAHAVAGRFDPPVDEDGVVHLDATVSAPALLEAALRAIRGDV
jgi:hypothetical protein